MFKNAKLGAKLIGSFFCVAVVAGTVGLVGYISLRTMSGHIEDLGKERVVAVQAIGAIAEGQEMVVIGERGLINRRMMEPTLRRAQYAFIEAGFRKAEEGFKQYEPIRRSREEDEVYKRVASQWDDWKRNHQAVRGVEEEKDRLLAGGTDLKSSAAESLDARAFSASLAAREGYLATRDLLSRLQDMNAARAREATSAADASASRSRALMVAVLVFGFLFAVGLGYVVSRSITRPMIQLAAVAEGVSRGETNHVVDHRSGDEIGQLSASFRNLVGYLKEVADAAEAIARGDLSVQVSPKSEGDVLSKGFLDVKQAVNNLILDVDNLARTAQEGRLDLRADVSRHEGDFRKIVDGVNRTLDAVTAPVNEAAGVLQRIAGRDLTARIQGSYHGDLAKIKENLNTMAGDLAQSIAGIAQNADALTTAAEELSSVSQQMGTNAEQTSSQASVASAASEQVSQSIQTVATASDEMNASIKEIAKSAADSARVTMNAVRVAEETNTSVAKLGMSSAEIGQVVKVITSIAQQTNLLALNATIEAARAGEAGKGFAVVANEVKELAKETAKATEEISKKIEAIQADAQSAVEAITQITEIITQVNDISGTIATAVEEQTATTNEIARNVAEAARGSAEIAQNVSSLAQVAQNTTGGAVTSQTGATVVSRMAGDLQQMVRQFQY